MIRIWKLPAPACAFLLTCLLLMTAQPLAAVEQQDPVSAAMAQFKRGDYAAALARFLSLDKGRQSPQTHYNIAVCYYRLGRFAEAQASFHKAAANPRLAPLAYYNLALIAAKQDDVPEALHRVEQVLAVAPEEKLRVLAQTLRARLQPNPSHVRWEATVSLGSGFDDNLLLVADTTAAASTRASGFTEFNAYAGGGWHRHGDWSFGGGLFANRYFSIGTYDSSTLYTRTGYATPVGSGTGEARANFSYSALAGASFSNSAELQLDWQGNGQARLQWAAGYRLARVNAHDPAYAGIDGWRHQLVLNAGWHRAGGRLAATGRVELNRRQSDANSPARQTIGLSYHRPLTARVDVTGAIEYRRSDYAVVDRLEERFGVSMESNYRVKRRWYIGARLRHTGNRSNVDAYDYVQNDVTGLLRWSF